MTQSPWFKPGIVLAVVILAALIAVGLYRSTRTAQPDAPSGALQSCLDKAERDPSRTERIALLKQATPQTRRDLLMDTGWATPPGTTAPDPAVAEACLKALALTTP